MKKIMAMVLALCSLCAICFAKLEQPKDERWVILFGEKDKTEYWIDSVTVSFNSSTEISHDKHNAAQIWISIMDYEKGLQAMILQEYDFQCRTVRNLGGSVYGDTGKLLQSYDKELSGTLITPGSGYESIMILLSDMETARENMDEYDKSMKEWKELTKQYKETGKIPDNND